MKLTLISSFFLALALVPQGYANPVELNLSGRPLTDVIRDISQRSGTEIVVADSLGQDRITAAIAEEGWNDAIKSLLADYNYEAQWNGNGKIQRVIVSGRNGNGEAAPPVAVVHTVAGDMLRYQAMPVILPEKFHALAQGSVMPINISTEELLAMNLGDRIGLTLPGGQYDVVHDNRFEHENGDVTWVGYLENEGKGYRVILTTGSEGTLGQVVTPDGVYNLDLQDGQTWLVDLNASGLQLSSLENDDADPHAANGHVGTRAEARTNTVSRMNVTKAVTANVAASTATTATTPVVDLLVLHTSGIKGAPTILTRINNLVAKANQAYIDSKVNLKLRVVNVTQVAYTETNSNDTALSDLTYGRSTFGNVATLRAQYGADLVTLIRPFNYKTQLSCGVAWVNGANGTTMSSRYGFSVVSDGTDAAGSYYCSDFTLAHELGHNMGSAHDVAHSNVQGKFPYSYGYGVSGKFGTIMSYYNPTIGFFSSPALTYNKQVLGNSKADNASSLNQTATTVAAFTASVK
jgi:hypothetical protein